MTNQNFKNKSTIIRTDLKKGTFSTILNSIVVDTNISADAFRVLVRALNNDKSFIINIYAICRELGINHEQKISKIVKELIANKYVERKKIQSGWEYIFREDKSLPVIFTDVKITDVKFTSVKNGGLINITNNKNNFKQKKEEKNEVVVTGISTSEKIENETTQQQSIFENEYLNYLNTIDLSYYNQVENTNTYSTEESILNQELDVENEVVNNIQHSTPQQQFSSYSNTMATKEKVLIEFQKYYFDNDAEQITNKFIQIQGLNFNEKYIQDRVEKWSSNEKRFIQKNAQEPVKQIKVYGEKEFTFMCNQLDITKESLIKEMFEGNVQQEELEIIAKGINYFQKTEVDEKELIDNIFNGDYYTADKFIKYSSTATTANDFYGSITHFKNSLNNNSNK